MKALVYTQPKEVIYQEEADPVSSKGEALIRVDAVGICGSDLHAYLGHDERRPGPLILGHEAAGVVVGGTLDGQRVTVNPLVTCGQCQACLSGRSNLCAKREIISMAPRQGAFAQCLTSAARAFHRNFSNLAQWEQSQLLSSIERLADMMDANELDAAPLLELNTMSASSISNLTKANADAPNN